MEQVIQFTKMHALGNDFVVIDGVTRAVNLSTADILRMSHRHTGIGFDQLLLIEPSQLNCSACFKYRIFNADGQEVAQCGNGARCVAHFIQEKGWLVGDKIKLETSDRVMEIICHNNNQYAVNMGQVNFSPEKIPLSVIKKADQYPLMVNNQQYSFVALSLGNPHAVFFEKNDFRNICAHLEESKLFSNGVNVGFAQVVSPGYLNLTVIERGVGETAACGSGACAAVIAGNVLNLLSNEVIVKMKGGELTVKYIDPTQPVWLIGPCNAIYEGSYKKNR